MSPYASELSHARLSALRKLIAALNEAETPDEKRRCAVAIFSAPDPCDLDDQIELVGDEEDADIDHDASEQNIQEHATDDQDDITEDETRRSDVETHPELAPPAPESMPPCAAALSDRSCDPATPSAAHPPAPFLPMSTTPASRLIAAAGRSP